jgi:hypothetical protein
MKYREKPRRVLLNLIIIVAMISVTAALSSIAFISNS